MNIEDTVTELEANFTHRGLHFTTPFELKLPLTAYGYLDGKRFYFEVGAELTTLRLGVYDQAKVLAYAQQENDLLNKVFHTNLPLDVSLINENNPKFIPKDVTDMAELYTAHLMDDNTSIEDIFTKLVERLVPIDELVALPLSSCEICELTP